MMQLVILDRDGVINYDSPNYIKSPAEWQAIPGSLDAITRLHQAGFQIAIATNQSGIARKLYTPEVLSQIHAKMLSALATMGGKVDAIFYCPHLPEDYCSCRKPQPGLLYKIAQHFNTSLTGIPMIGDSYKDIQAAQLVGCKPILVRTGNGENTLAQYPELHYSAIVVKDLNTAVDKILEGM